MERENPSYMKIHHIPELHMPVVGIWGHYYLTAQTITEDAAVSFFFFRPAGSIGNLFYAEPYQSGSSCAKHP